MNRGGAKTLAISRSQSPQDLGSAADEYLASPSSHHLIPLQSHTMSTHSTFTAEPSETSSRFPGQLSTITKDEELGEPEVTPTATEISTVNTGLTATSAHVIQELLQRIAILENEVLTPETLSKLIDNKDTVLSLIRRTRLTGVMQT
ncbi:Hypothetical protein GLP15_133 [Giardia lamblia P15]|uniref:Uncharacterized protein n=1 Tax=Giardia intestinalis (strain P15) TaxID=658858 RepID=E1EWY9_GIAIA|nr:Hypothetical protein GLP15_133 [Giardia lamblia P15]